MYFQLISIAVAMYISLYTIGFVFSNTKVSVCGNYALLGSIYSVVGLSVISNISQLSIPTSSVVFVVVTLFTGVYKRLVFKKNSYKQEMNIKGFCLGLIFILVNFVIILLSKKIFGVGNFDFFNAIQDGTYLQNNNSLDSYTNNQLMPLTWSAGIGSRYGISLLLALFNSIFPNISALIIGQASLVLFSSLGSVMLYILASKLFKKKKELIFIAVLATNFSALVIYQINNQMIGQITALPVAYLILILVLSYKDSYSLNVYLAISIFALYILYPSIILPVALTIILFMLFKIRRGEIAPNSFVPFLMTIPVLYILIYSSNPLWPIRMLMSFTLPQAGGTTLNPQANLFPQLTSLIGPGQFLGTIPIPYVGSWSIAILLLSFLSCTAIIFQLYALKKESYIGPSEYQLISSFLFGFFAFALYSFIIGNSYVVLKVATWIAPFIILNFLMYVPTTNKNYVSIAIIPRALVVILLLCNFNISFQEITRMRNGKSTSFPQLILPSQAASISEYVDKNPDLYGIYSPTAEEATWIAINLPESLKSSYSSVGAQNQALAEIEKVSCTETQQRRALLNINKLIVKQDIIDITPRVKIRSKDEEVGFQTKDWLIGDIKSFDSFMTVYSGLFPPTLNSQMSINPIPLSSSLRWSSGRACFGFYSRVNGLVSVRFPILLGPDAGIESKIESQSAAKLAITNVDPTLTIINLEQPVSIGWNFISLNMSEVSNLRLPRFFQVRADARKLRFAIGSISFILKASP
jgi:hypothetical protein